MRYFTGRRKARISDYHSGLWGHREAVDIDVAVDQPDIRPQLTRTRFPGDTNLDASSNRQSRRDGDKPQRVPGELPIYLVGLIGLLAFVIAIAGGSLVDDGHAIFGWLAILGSWFIWMCDGSRLFGYGWFGWMEWAWK
jgi:hypothetical protein